MASMGTLTALWLDNNNIGDQGMIAFSEAIGNGSLPALQKVVVDSKHERLPQLVAACQPRGITIA